MNSDVLIFYALSEWFESFLVHPLYLIPEISPSQSVQTKVNNLVQGILAQRRFNQYHQYKYHLCLLPFHNAEIALRSHCKLTLGPYVSRLSFTKRISNSKLMLLSARSQAICSGCSVRALNELEPNTLNTRTEHSTCMIHGKYY